ncbi:LPXTG cell wall anchor domain-containing protein [Rossellomorea yichunensis]|uniref:LPXTG cell wall anchor domain-containing protein n=1 Tax=Rossellomorea yichunensis TaxID=3077331 RepID=UPI0028DD489F|nr:LPXTG cell wall anchor domain-containing protein [Rossellomorea sp. YC4-1]MDT9026775.1 LPXTG cell wall anchor domain-containing protein [Rossellomorea sp. YC4-1]
MNQKRIAVILLILFFISGIMNHKTYANEVDIILIPNEKFLFNISNMKPGDWAERELRVKNGGEKDFNYSIRVDNKQSDRKLFNELDLKVYEGDKSILIFDDKLKNFTGFKPKPLKKGVTDSLFFQVEMPYELGNEFQQTSAYFEMIIVAAANTSTTPEDSDDPVKQPESNVKPTPVNPGTNDTQLPVASQGPKLPNTATNLYLLLTVGLILTTVGLTIIYVNKRLSNKRET